MLAGSYLVAVALRLAHAAANPPDLLPRGDNTFFAETARSVAAGDWGRLPTMDGGMAISVKFPPAWSWTLGLGDRLLWFVPTDTAHVVVSAVVGATVAPLTALLVWRILDRTAQGVALLVSGGATLLAAGHPLLLGAATARMSEVLVVPLGLSLLLGMHRILRGAAGPGTAPALGALLAVAALVRPEALVVWGAALGVVALLERRWSIVLTPLVVASVPVLAYSAHVSVHAGSPVLVSTNAASAIAGANCDEAWSGDGIGHWSEVCLQQVWLGRISPVERRSIFAHDLLRSGDLPPQLGPRLEAQLQDAHQRGSVHAIRHDPHLFARAVPARVARGLGLWWSPDQTFLEVVEGRAPGWERAGRWVHLVVVLPPFALAAVGVARRRGRVRDALDRCVDRRVLLPGAVVFGLWLFGVALSHGSTRHRSAVDAVVLLGAAVGWAMIASGYRLRGDPDGHEIEEAPGAARGRKTAAVGLGPDRPRRDQPSVVVGAASTAAPGSS